MSSSVTQNVSVGFLGKAELSQQSRTHAQKNHVVQQQFGQGDVQVQRLKTDVDQSMEQN